MDAATVRKQKCYIAVDVPDLAQAANLLTATGPYFDAYKVGLQLFLREGRAAVQLFRDAGKRVFLDLKLHDIPATVGKAMAAVADLEPDLLTVHAAGGKAMVAAAAEAAATCTKILGVTVLTSIDDAQSEHLFGTTAAHTAKRWLADVRAGGGHGFVSSVWEVSALKEAWPEAVAVTPGIRLAGDASQDQKRVASPAAALQAGSDILVLGRSITQAEDVGLAVAQLDVSLADSATVW